VKKSCRATRLSRIFEMTERLDMGYDLTLSGLYRPSSGVVRCRQP